MALQADALNAPHPPNASRCAPSPRARGEGWGEGTTLARHFRMPRSAEVSASENAGRANSRSAYFISGAACLGIWMP